MSKVQTIIKELDQLNAEDLELVLSEIKKRINRKKRAESLLNEYVGKGKGIWGEDAQEYVNKLREEDRSVQKKPRFTS